MADWTSIIVEPRRGIVRVSLNRPERRNAFDQRMVGELRESFAQLATDQSIRGIVLTGTGPIFCAGADLRWLNPDNHLSVDQAQEDARLLSEMYRAIDECPHPVIARVQGNAFGGGVGLLAVCDVVVAVEEAMFTLSEVQFGLMPAVVAPFLLRKAGASFMRRFCLTAESFSAAVAKQFNLVHEVTTADLLDSRIGELGDLVLRVAPEATRRTKAMLRQLQAVPANEQETLSAEANVQARLSAEAKEGLRAFLEKRSPAWKQAMADQECEPMKGSTHHASRRA